MTNDDTDALIDRYLDGTASEEEVAVLSQLLEDDAHARAHYLRLASLHASLASGVVAAAAPETECISCSREPLPTAQDERPVGQGSSGFRLLAAGRSAADLILGMLSALLLWAYMGLRRPRPAGHDSWDESRPETFGALNGARPGRLTGAVAAVGAVLTLLVIGLGRWPGPDPRPMAIAPNKANTPTDSIKEPRASGFAILTRAVDVVWAEGRPGLAAGSVLSEGVLRFRSGVLQLEFYGGATVIAEGPAEIELMAIDRISCRYGKLRALISSGAHGFRVDSPSVDLVDLGTEFGMRVTPDRKAEVHVFDGKVELHKPNPQPGQETQWELAEGNGVRIGLDGGITRLAADSRAFLTPLDLDGLYHEESARRYGEWLGYSRARASDRRLVTYFLFEGDRRSGRRALVDQCGERARDGTIVGCEWVDGRWTGKGALEFKRPGDRVRFQVPGEFESLTFTAWVRIDAIEHRFSSLMLTDGFELGEPHWQIDWLGRIVLGIRATVEQSQPDWFWNYRSPSVFTPERLGRWTHLVTVYDGRTAVVTHYVDGTEVAREALKRRTVLRIGDAELGNWGVPDNPDSWPIRNLCGRMDEFALFRAAIGPDEVRALYERGAP